MLDYKNIGSRIKERRKALNMSQEDLALSVGYKGKSIISRIEKGEIDLPQSRIIEISKALDCAPAFLLDGMSELTVDNMAKQLRLSRETGIPLHKLGVNPAELQRMIEEEKKKDLIPIVCNDYEDDAPHFVPIKTDGRKPSLDMQIMVDVSESMSNSQNSYLEKIELHGIINQLSDKQISELLNFAKYLKSLNN